MEGLTVVPAVSGGWGGGSDGCTCSKWGVGRRVFATPKGTVLHCYAHDHITMLSLRKTKDVYF